MFKTKPILLTLVVLILLIAVGVGAFMAGRNAGLTEQLNIRTEFFQQRAGTMRNAPGAADAAGNPAGAPGGTGDAATGARGAALQGRQLVNGVVKSVQGNTVTVTQQRDGSTTTLTIDDKTVIEKMTAGTLADIQPGWRITAVEQTTGGATTRRVVLTPGQ